MPKLYNTATRKEEELDGVDLQTALAQGTHSYPAGTMVRVKGPDGGDYELPAENVTKALSQGYQVETPTQTKVREYVEENQGLKGAVKVGVLQAADELALGLPELIYQKKGDPLEVAKWEALKKEHDYANTIGGVTGFAGSLFVGAPLFKGASKAGEKVAEQIAQRLIASSAGELSKRTAMETARNLAGRMVAKGAGGITEGALLAAPHAITEAALGDPEDAAETLLAGVGIGAIFGTGGELAKDLFKLGVKGGTAAMTGGKMVADSAGDGAKIAARKIAKVLTGVNEEDILHYTQNLDRVNKRAAEYGAGPGLNPLEALKTELDDGVSKLQETISLAKEKEITLKKQLDEAYNLERQRLSQTRAPETLAQDILGEQQNLKSVLGNYSEQLYDALDRAPGTISTSNLKKFVTDQMEGLKVGSKDGAVFGESAKKEFSRLQGLKADLDTLPGELSFNEAKQIIKQMDPDLNFNMGAGEFNEISQRNGKQFRKFLNDQIRDASPEVRGILNRMSDLSDVLNRFNQKFGTIEKAVSNVNNIFTPRGKLNRELLEEMSQLTGKDFVSPLAEYEKAKVLLDKSKVKDIRSELLPELSKQHADAAAEAARLTEDLGDVVRRLNPNQTQNVLRNQGFKNPSIENRKALERFSELTGKDYNEVIKDLSVYNSFYKESTNGSRKTLLGSVIGSLVGGPVGTAAGGAAGASMDIYGGQLLKKLIDSTPNVSGLLFAEKAMKRAAEKLDAVPSVLKRLGDATPVKPRTASLYALERLLTGKERPPAQEAPSAEQRTRQLKELREKTAVFVANPTQAAQKINELVNPVMSGGAPQIGKAFSMKMSEAANYLYNELPKPPRARSPFAPQVQWQPSDAELRAYEQKLEVVADPFVVLRELSQGTLTKHHMDALRKVYPKIHTMIQTRVQKEVINGVKPVPYNQRVKLSLLMDAPMDVSMTPGYILDLQKTWAQPDNTVDPRNAKEVQIAEQTASDVQRIMG